MSVDKINECLQVCGSKTSKCQRCGEYVKAMEKDIHINEGFCDVMFESKKEKESNDINKELEKF